MTVADLMRLLAEFPPASQVLVDGYEAGFDNPARPRVQRVRPLDWEAGALGDYEEADNEAGAFDAVVIARTKQPED